MLFLKIVEGYAWLAFAAAWAHMGWVDWTQQKIRHHFLVLWLKFALLGHVALIGHSLLGSRGYTASYLLPDYYWAQAGYWGASALAAGVLWMLRIWPAGDVKLYGLLALWLPLLKLPGDFRYGLRFLEVLINTFIPACVFLFASACVYLWRTRFSHQKDFVVELGAGKLAGWLFEKAREALRLAWEETRGWARGYWAHPKAFLFDTVNWLSMLAAMSLVSYALGDLVRSNFLKTALCFALFFGWSRFCMLIGRGWALALVLGGFGVFVLSNPSVNWPVLAASFGHISLFSLCLFFGIQIAFKLVAGQAGFLFMPLVFMLPGLLPYAWTWLKELAMPDLPSALPALGAPPWLAELAGLWTWAAMGLFFGLSLVFVRIWDSESYRSVPPEHIQPFMTPGPALVEALRRDAEFFEEHFSTLYADGLTPDQVQALREWCRENQVKEVPLAPTISFANWVFFGYFLTVVLGGHVLKFVY